MVKGFGLQSFDCEAACVCHRRSKIAMQYLRVTRAATGVCSAHGRYHVDRRLLCVPQNSTGQPDGKKRRSACQRHRAISVRPA